MGTNFQDIFPQKKSENEAKSLKQYCGSGDVYGFRPALIWAVLDPGSETVLGTLIWFQIQQQ
jgi:hypothetical protein